MAGSMLACAESMEEQDDIVAFLGEVTVYFVSKGKVFQGIPSAQYKGRGCVSEVEKLCFCLADAFDHAIWTVIANFRMTNAEIRANGQDV